MTIFSTFSDSRSAREKAEEESPPVPLLEPNVAGIHWAMSNPPAFPETPILSIIQLNLHPGCGIQNGGQPATRLWNASLDYVCSIPGSTAIYWAPLKDDPETLIILLQWEDAYSWRQFQESVGFSLMRGLLTRNYLFNRSARLALPDISQHSDLELVTFQFKRDTSSERKQQFEEAWKDLRQSANGNSNSDVIICGEWVERDGPNPNYPNWQAQVSKSDSQAMYFLAFLFWRPGVRYSDSGSLRQKAAALTEVPDDSRSILTCSLRREMKANPEEAQIITPIKSTSSLLSTPIARKYRTNDRFDFSYDPIAFKSYHDMRANKRLHFCPRGVNIAMGHLHQNPGPIHPLGFSQDVFDLFWLKKTMEEEQPAPWQDLQKKNITLLPADVYTGQSEDQPDHLALLIFWKSHEKRSDHVDDMNHSVKQFASTSNCVIESEQSFCGGSPGWSTKEVYIEIVIFYIPLNSSIQMTKDLFETVYYDFERTTHHAMTGYFESACVISGGKWDEEPISKDGMPMLRFTCNIKWDNKATSEEWYQDFARGAIESYERLGHIIDRFQLLNADVESLCLRLERSGWSSGTEGSSSRSLFD